MTPAQYQRLEVLFHEVMERRPEERESFARELCNGDSDLLPNLMALLRSAGQQTDSLDTPIARFHTESELPAFSPNEVLLERFRIVRFLGRGGMGEVYEADDLETGRVALKTIRPEIAAHPRFLARFRNEVQCARKATGTNVCRIHELFSIPASAGRAATAFLTMEFLEGITLAERLDTGPQLSIEEAENIAVQICRGLQTIHEAEIIHRDLKSRNIMLAARKRGTDAVLMDFGLARETVAATASAAAPSSVSAPGTVVGTPQYMAPEQFQGGKLTPAADIYALGIVLYEMAAGKLPFEGATPLAAAVERAKPLAAVSSIRKGVPHRWDTTIERCVCYRPEDRFQTAAEVAESLTARSRWQMTIPRDARRLASVLSVLLVIAAALSFVWYRWRSEPAGGSAQAKHWYDEGIAALREGTYLKASNALQMAVDSDKKFVLAHARLADAWNELDFANKAKDEILEASAFEPGASLSALDEKYVEAVRHTIVRDFAAALRDYREIFDSLPREKKADGYVDLGRAYEKTGDIAQAIASYSSAAKLDPDDPAPFVRLGVLESRRKQTAAATAAFEKAERLYRATSNLEGVAEIEYEQGNDANTQLHLDEARTYLQKSLETARTIPSPQLEIRALTRLSVTEYLGRNTDKAIALANQAIALAQENGLEYWEIDGQIRLGNAYISRADYAQAGSQLEHALTLAQRGQHPRLVALAQLSLSFVRERQNKPDEVIPLARGALDYYRSVGFASESVEALTVIVRAQRDKADNQAALKSANELLAFATKLEKPAAMMRAEEALGSVLLDLERYPEAFEHFQKALEISRELKSQIDYQLLHCADVLWRLGEYDSAERALAAIPAASKARADVSVTIQEIRSGMLLSRNRYATVSDIAKSAVAAKSDADPAYFERLVCQIESVSGSPAHAEKWCRKALAQAQTDSDRGAAAQAQLALANACLLAGSAAQALPFAENARDFFLASGQKESLYFSLLSLAKIWRALKDVSRSRKFARQGMDILSEFEHNYLPQQYRNYLSRPDVHAVEAGLAQLAS